MKSSKSHFKLEVIILPTHRAFNQVKADVSFIKSRGSSIGPILLKNSEFFSRAKPFAF